MNGYELSRNWFDWCFENPEKINPNHTALYFFMIEHCNRLGWREKFGLPTEMAKDAIGIKSYNTYIKTLRDLVDFGFVTMIEKSKNQYSSNIVALSKFNKALDKALDKAMLKHLTKQDESISSINKQLTLEQLNISFDDFWDLYDKKVGKKEKLISKWNSLSETEKQKIMDYIPKYKIQQPNKSFRKDPMTFFNNESWNDEIFGVKSTDTDEIPDYIQKQLDAITARPNGL